MLKIFRTCANILYIIDGEQTARTSVDKTKRTVTVWETSGIDRNAITGLLVEYFPWLSKENIRWFEDEG